MAKPLALIHTSPVLVPTFTALCAEHMPGRPVFHMVDESLIKNTVAAGGLRRATVRRLIGQIESAFGAGAAAVLVTCSSIGEGVSLAQPLFDEPVLRVDGPMAEAAVAWPGRTVGVLATLKTTLEPTVRLICETAAARGVTREVVARLCDGAFEAVLAGDTALHDRMVREALVRLTGEADVVVLAQASMARVLATVPDDDRRVPVLSSPGSAVARAAEVLAGLGGESGPG